MLHVAPPPPPTLESLPAGTVLVAGLGTATILPDFDFETYSEAGFEWDEEKGKWGKPPGTPPNKEAGISVCGAAVYSEHPTTEVLSLYYDLKDGRGRRHWKPGDPPPYDLFAHIAAGGLLEAWKSAFEMWIWENVCVARMGWPPLPQEQVRCAMAKARAHALPGALDAAGDVLQLKNQKKADGKRLIKKFSVPQNPTKARPTKRIRMEDDPEDAAKFYDYNEHDIISEAEASSRTPDLSPDELAFWQADQIINRRGVAMDGPGIANCIAIVEQAFALYNAELYELTQHAVEKASQLERLKAWAATRGVYIGQLREEDLDELLKRKDLPRDVYRALEIRSKIGSASIKKLFAMRNQTSLAGRLHDLFNYHAARTGRATGAEVQPQNLPKAGPDVFGPSKDPAAFKCCGRYFGAHRYDCPWCGAIWPPTKPQEWTFECVADALEVIGTRSLHAVEYVFGDALGLVVGVLRSLFVAAPGHDLIASDYSAIEGVVTAALAGEQWRLEVFAAGEDIYLAGASKITGISVEVYKEYKKRTGKHHPDRQPFGKVSELSSGYGGWIGAWIQFGADEFFTEDEMKKHILAWRAASPGIVELWGGQFRGLPWETGYRAEYFGLEGMAVQAVLNPGRTFTYKANHPLAQPISYVVHEDILYCVLPSGRRLTYHRPRLRPGSAGLHKDALSLSFEGWNTNPKNGPKGWIRMNTYGGKLTENVVQAVARDILAYAIVNLTRAGWPVVLHVHDEIVAEILKVAAEMKKGTIAAFEAIMATLPWWAKGWPLRAAGGWIGERYRKD